MQGVIVITKYKFIPIRNAHSKLAVQFEELHFSHSLGEGEFGLVWEANRRGFGKVAKKFSKESEVIDSELIA